MNTSNNEPFITVDQLEDIFSQTFGNIGGSGGLVVWCWVTNSSMSLDVRNLSASTYIAIAWFLSVLLIRALMFLNLSMVSGFSRFKLDPQDDTILITGGASGLGLVLSAMFSAEGFQTIALDVQKPSIEIANSCYYQCDVGDPTSVDETIDKIVKEQTATPSVLINCAGTVSKSLGSIETLDVNDIKRVIDTNLFGSIHVTQQLLRANPAMKMLVGISSSTALASPAYAGTYAASKAGVRTFFESLRHELRNKPPRVLCVSPGQLDTAMFKNVPTPSQFWAPVIGCTDAATTIFDAVKEGRQGELATPLYSRLLPYILLLPSGLLNLLRRYIGIDSAALQRRHEL